MTTIYQRLQEASEREFVRYIERQVDIMFEAYRHLPGAGDIHTTNLVPTPVIDVPRFRPGLDDAELRWMVRTAMMAREEFVSTAPIWAPRLPVSPHEFDQLANEESGRLRMVGLFGESWRNVMWNHRHPSFHRYTTGLLASESCPESLYSDYELRRDFRPEKLEGMDKGTNWRSPEMVAAEAAWDAFRKGPAHPTSRPV
jgi:hypothetical protein